MGHCFSCFHSISESSTAVSPDQSTRNNKDEITGVEERTVVNKINSDGINEATLQPLLSNDVQRNGNKRTTLNYLSALPSNSNASTPVMVLGVGDSHKLGKQHLAATSGEKSQRSFYNKIPMPLPLGRSASSGEYRTSSDNRINTLFELYKDATEDAILSDGIERLCNDLQLCPDEFQVLVLAWKLNAQQMCCFTRAEFTQGLKNIKVDSIKGLQIRLPEIVSELIKDNELFKELYRFTFKFGLDVATGQRILPVDVAVVLWRLVFTICQPPILSKWLKYLEQHPHIRGIPKDTWYMFLNFSDTVGVDLSTYDDTEAWPSLFDDFVEYQNDQMNQNISKNDTVHKISD